ncbi:MAG: OadG family protein [Calditrichaceae bacterium]|nr:OadG family protein [Calditrichia bacterium]NUQ43723.1 OadG family protein [Calditrichaceae bacterium]
MNETISFGVNLTIVGLCITFAALAAISLGVALMRWLDEKGHLREEREKQLALEKEQTIDNLTLVLIAAAVGTMLQGRFYIRSVRRIPLIGERASPWSMQGRAVLLGSHVVGRKPS